MKLTKIKKILTLFFCLILFEKRANVNIKKCIESINSFNSGICRKRYFLYIEDKNKTNFANRQSIEISLSTDNSNIYPTLIVMTSILENNKPNHIIIFFLLLSIDFKRKNLFIFESLKKNYEVIINYCYIHNIFNNLKKWRNSYAIYFKLFLPLLLKDEKRIIHLDGDTMVFSDLWEMYNLPFYNNYLLAQRTKNYKFKDKKNKKWVINAGVILFNIEKFRKDNKDFEIFYYLFKYKFTEQDALNYVLLPNIGYLPFKYGIVFNNPLICKKKLEYSIL